MQQLSYGKLVQETVVECLKALAVQHFELNWTELILSNVEQVVQEVNIDL